MGRGLGPIPAAGGTAVLETWRAWLARRSLVDYSGLPDRTRDEEGGRGRRWCPDSSEWGSHHVVFQHLPRALHTGTVDGRAFMAFPVWPCLLYTSDAADDLTRVDLGGRRIIAIAKGCLLYTSPSPRDS